jgi:hypothetical protein
MMTHKAKLTVLFTAAIFSSLAIAQSPATTAPAQKKAAPAEKPAADPLKGLSKRRDDMKGMTWYKHPSSPKYRNANGFYLYFGKEDSGTFTPLRLAVQYYSEDWLFIRSAWAKADNERVDVPHETSRYMGWERDNSGGSIWEWSDTALTSSSEKSVVRTLANAKKVTVRFEGRQYYDDRTISAAQQKAMREVITAYEAATGKPWN